MMMGKLYDCYVRLTLAVLHAAYTALLGENLNIGSFRSKLDVLAVPGLLKALCEQRAQAGQTSLTAQPNVLRTHCLHVTAGCKRINGSVAASLSDNPG